jgi:hypothetical protein
MNKNLTNYLTNFKMITQEQLDALSAKVEGYKAQDVEVSVLKADLEALKGKETIEKSVFENLQEQVNQLKEMKVTSTVKTIVDEIKENKETLRAIAKGGNAEVVLKADTLRASIATNPHVALVDGIGQLQRKKRSLYELFRKIPVGAGNHNGTIAYVDWDEATTVKAAASVAEGVAFAESTAKFKGYTLALQKIGDSLPVSEEFFNDEVMAAAELEVFLDANVLDKIASQIVVGDNTGTNLKGLITSSPAYTAVASGIADANIYDLIAKVSEDITSVGGAKYQPDFVAMNIADINKLKLKKDSTYNYVFNFNDPRIGALNIVEDNNVPANTLYLGDSRFARIYEMGGVVVSKGYNGTDFAEDMLTLKARKRLAFLIREADKTGFRKVASISAALTTLAT